MMFSILPMMVAVFLSLSSAELDLDCVANGHPDLLGCNNYMQIYLQSFTGNGNNGDQGYSNIQFPYNVTASPEDISAVVAMPLKMGMTLAILGVSDVDIVTGSMTLNVALALEWTDYRLQWNISKTLGIDESLFLFLYMTVK